VRVPAKLSAAVPGLRARFDGAVDSFSPDNAQKNSQERVGFLNRLKREQRIPAPVLTDLCLTILN
jgi:hypothetical protein